MTKKKDPEQFRRRSKPTHSADEIDAMLNVIDGYVDKAGAESLLMGVFVQAFRDMRDGSKAAMEWFGSPRARMWADMLNYNPDVMVENARRVGGEFLAAKRSEQ